ncbi:Retrovirus-related Pol polyprotein [Stylophora pistillata]|uniref:Retrovirus-related Pol polyprotein n=1 Tax=Stylophora pistillata TaxID=50429 RepID=A0A2B4RA74_STYPI|nr:Retrovirus-related Pol polyprotein [Stylophora pistillata]
MSTSRANGHPLQKNLSSSRRGILATGTRTCDVKHRGNFAVQLCTHVKNSRAASTWPKVLRRLAGLPHPASSPLLRSKTKKATTPFWYMECSASNLISKDTLQELKYQGLKIELKPCLKRLYAYGGRELKIEGQFQTEVSVPKAKVVADFIVVESGRCLLGYSSATDLGILRVDLSGTLGTGDCNTVDGTFVGGLKAKYPSVFQGIGKLKDYQLKLHIDPSVTPVVQKMRRVPFSVKDKVTAKVNELLEKDIIEKVEGPTVWVSPVVVAPKPSGDIRLCVDMRRANEAIIRERLPIPTIDEVLESLNGSGVFSKLDLRWGFHQIELDPDSRDITAFTTHDGIFRYKRLSFGVNAAPEKYQHIITQSMAGLQGVSNIADDLIVHGRDTEEHDKNLHSVLQRLSEKQLTLNAEKCTFRMTKVVFMGLLLSKHGIGPTEEKVRAVAEASQPQTPSEVRSFLGLVGFSARFIPDFATTADPLRKLARKGEPFVWGKEQEQSFQRLKSQVASAPVLAYFDKDTPTRVIADASPVGLGAVLVQEKNGESRAICYASRSLSQVERRYSQTEKEALALVWACERFHLYLYGLPQFDLVTDHEALKVIYSRKSKPSARIERWVLRLQPYNYQVCYVPSRKNIADALSRLTKIPASDNSAEDDGYVRAIALHAVPAALRIKEIEQMVTKNVPPSSLKSTPLANQPCEEVAVDLMGPLPSGEHLLVLVDYYSRWIEVDVIRTTSSKTIIHCLNAQFARHGLPKGKSPAELLFRRKLTTIMPELVKVEEEKVEVSDQAVRDRDNQRKQFNKDYVDKKFHARDRDVRGDSVLLEKKKENKLSPCYEKEPYQTELKPFETPPMAEDEVPMAESPPEDVPSTVHTAEQHVRRSSRITSRPKALSDYVLY